MESILKLHNMGTSEDLPWQFFFRNGNYLTRYFFNREKFAVDFDVRYFSALTDLFAFIRYEYEICPTSFIIYEMEENEIMKNIEMPCLLSTSCRELDKALKVVKKGSNKFYFLYDPLEFLEFEHLIKVCCSFQGLDNSYADSMIRRNKEFGGLLRPTFQTDFTSIFATTETFDAAKAEALKVCTPFNVHSDVNALVGIKFNLGLERNDSLWDVYHDRNNWQVKFLTLEIAVEVGKKLKVLPSNISPEYMYQIQEAANLFGGPLRKTDATLSLPDNYYIEKWAFYDCSTFSNPDRKCSLAECASLNSTKKANLIKLLPQTSSISIFKGQILMRPFSELSTKYVYRSSVHNGILFDCMTADPKNRRLFLFQSTTSDPLAHGCGITGFLSAMNGLQVKPDELQEIYYYMLASAHKPSDTQHFFYFHLSKRVSLHCCFLSKYVSEHKFLMEKVFIISDKRSPPEFSAFEVSQLNDERRKVLQTIPECYEAGRNVKKSVTFEVLTRLINETFTKANSINLQNIEEDLCQDDFFILKRLGIADNFQALKLMTSENLVQKLDARKALFSGALKKLESGILRYSLFTDIERECFSTFQISIENDAYFIRNLLPARFRKVYLEEKQHQALHSFLCYAKILKPIICRTSFYESLIVHDDNQEVDIK